MVEAIPLDVTTQLTEAAETRASETEDPTVVAVVNSEGNLTARYWVSGAQLTSVNTSCNKAYASVALDTPACGLAEASEPGNPLCGLDIRGGGWMAVSGSGYPFERGDEAVGAISVLGGAVIQDHDIAEAGIERWTKLVEVDAVPSDDWAVPRKCERLTTDRESDRTRKSMTPAARPRPVRVVTAV